MDKQKQQFREEFLESINGYFNMPNVLSDYIQPVVSSSVWSVLTAIWRHTVGRQRWAAHMSISYIMKMTGLSKPTVLRSVSFLEEANLIMVEKQKNNAAGYGATPSIIRINRTTVKILYQVDKATVKNLYRGWLKNFTMEGKEPVKIFYLLKTINKNIKNREEPKTIVDEDEGVELLSGFLKKIGRRGLKENSEGGNVYDIDDGKKAEQSESDSLPNQEP